MVGDADKPGSRISWDKYHQSESKGWRIENPVVVYRVWRWHPGYPYQLFPANASVNPWVSGKVKVAVCENIPSMTPNHKEYGIAEACQCGLWGYSVDDIDFNSPNHFTYVKMEVSSYADNNNKNLDTLILGKALFWGKIFYGQKPLIRAQFGYPLEFTESRDRYTGRAIDKMPKEFKFKALNDLRKNKRAWRKWHTRET